MARYVFHTKTNVSLDILDCSVAEVPAGMLICRDPRNLGLDGLEKAGASEANWLGAFTVTEFADRQQRWQRVLAVRLNWRQADPFTPDTERRGQYVDNLQSRVHLLLMQNHVKSVVMTPLGWRYPQLVALTMLGALTGHAMFMASMRRDKDPVRLAIAAPGAADIFTEQIETDRLQRYLNKNGRMGCPPRLWLRPEAKP
ncbi:MAG: hypothetical protein RBU25_03895 [Lentisphaeria bacterium]|jgi:hypothetical protein|nr:hypothetical protein [Lentisphaeria bacterium]